MDSTMGALEPVTALEDGSVVWYRAPGARRPELVPVAQARVMDEADRFREHAAPISEVYSTRLVELHEAPSVEMATSTLVDVCHGASMKAGWWENKHLGDTRRYLRAPESGLERFIAGLLFSNKLCLIHSEVSESMEGDRKSLPDDKLPQYPMRVVELADALIRTLDLAGAIIPEDAGFTFGEVVAAKMAFNAQRADHKPEARAAEGGKAY